MEWSNELVLEFLDLFEREEAIWNGKHEQHKNKDAVHEAWIKIKNDFSGHCSVTELKKKKESLMSTFRKINQKVKNSMKTEYRPEDVYKPHWFAYEKMDNFLHNVYRPTGIKYSKGLIQEIDTPGSSRRISDDNSEPLSDSPSQESSSSTWRDFMSTRKRKFKEPAMQVKSRLDEDNNYSISVPDRPDHCSLYGQLLAAKLRDFDQHKQQLAMLQIDQLMYILRYQRIPNPSPFNVQLPLPDNLTQNDNNFGNH